MNDTKLLLAKHRRTLHARRKPLACLRLRRGVFLFVDLAVPKRDEALAAYGALVRSEPRVSLHVRFQRKTKF